MPMGTRHHLTGRLMQEPRGLVLEVDGGGAMSWMWLGAPTSCLATALPSKVSDWDSTGCM